MKIRKKFAFILSIALPIITTSHIPTANAAAKPMPKVGSCYNLTKADVAADYSDIAPINCLKEHSAETYRVVKLKANDLAVNYDLKKAITVCAPWKGRSKFLNYWAWYIPTPEQQKITSLKTAKDRASDALKAERDRQKKQSAIKTLSSLSNTASS